MNTDEILVESASALEGLAAGFVVVGGTAHRLLSKQPQAAPVDFEPLATLDIDLVVPTHCPIPGSDLQRALLAKGFEEELVGVGQRAGARYRWRSSPCYLQFWVRRIGSERDSGGKALSLGGLLAEGLPHLAVLLAEPVPVELPMGGRAAFMAMKASRPAPPRAQDLAAVCAEVVSSIRRVALGE